MAKLPALPPSPVWLKGKVPDKLLPLLFWPAAVVAGFLVFFVGGLVVGEFEWALLLGLLAGPALGYLAAGPPFTRAMVAQAAAKVPQAPPEKRPFLFFPAALLAAGLLYFVVGFVLTSAPLDEDVLALLALAVALPAGVAVGYLRFGFPRPKGGLRELRSPLERVPEDKRPLLFFPLGLLFAAPLYLLIGYALTELLDPDVAVLLALLAALAAGFAGASRLVGVPHPAHLRERLRMPDVPARARPPAFVAFVLVVGTLLAVALGGTVGALDALDVVGTDLAFPLFVLAGWLLAVPLAGRLFGYPVPEQPLRAYLPRLGPEQRPAALVPLTLGLGALLTLPLGMVLGLVPLGDLEDAALTAALAFPLGLVLALRILGLSAREVDPRGLERVPERARPLAVLGLALLLGTLLYMALGNLDLPFLAAALLSLALGLGAALALVDRPYLGSLARQRAERRRKAREIEARLRAEMGLGPEAQAAEGPRRRGLRRRG